MLYFYHCLIKATLLRKVSSLESRRQAATHTIQAEVVDDDNYIPLRSMRHSVSVTFCEADGTAQLLVCQANFFGHTKNSTGLNK